MFYSSKRPIDTSIAGEIDNIAGQAATTCTQIGFSGDGASRKSSKV